MSSDLERKLPSSCPNFCYELIGKFFTHYPARILVVTLGFATILSWIGLAKNGLPEFSDPYLGFQTRFTPIANRLISLENLRLEVNKLEILENYPAEHQSEREWKRKRRKRSITTSSGCTEFPLEEYGRIGLELRGVAKHVLSRETLALISYFQQLVQATEFYSHLCEMDLERNCCPMWSLPNYVAIWANKSNSLEIETEDVLSFTQNMVECNGYYVNKTSNEECLFRRRSCPEECHHGGLFHTALYYTMDKFSLSKNSTKYVMVVLPIPKSSQSLNLMDNFQQEIWSLRLSLPSKMITVAGFDFGGRERIFKQYLIADLQYVAIASLIIFAIVLIFTKSIFVTLISFGVLLLSLGTSYFVYKTIFGISYFPFMNMLVTIIILGIGTDSTLIVSAAWERSKLSRSERSCDNNEPSRFAVSTLQDTTITLFITTCTTAGAFFASLTSSITTIRCFSIFAGTAIIISFILLYICVPLTLHLNDSIWHQIPELLPRVSQRSKVLEKSLLFCKKLQKVQNKFCCSSIRLLFSSGVSYTSTSIIFWFSSFILCTCVVLWSSYGILYGSKFRLPNSEEFQLLSSAHPVEVFSRVVEPEFSESEYSDPNVNDLKVTLYLVWGILPADNGNALNPNDVGKLQFDSKFSLSPSVNQKWMRKLCREIQKLEFYDSNSNAGLNLDSCFMNTYIRWMKRDCLNFIDEKNSYKPCCNTSKFPYEYGTFFECIGFAARDVYRTPSFYFQPDIAGPKFFTHSFNHNEPYAHVQKNITQLRSFPSETLATYTVRIQTNVTYSVVYEKMAILYETVEKSFEQLMRTAPEGLENGFIVSPYFEFYDLQKSLLEETWTSLLLSVGLCFMFLCVASKSLIVSTGAVICIFAIVLVTWNILVEFFGWQLGVFESVAVTVAVGLSDFTAHHALEFSKSNSLERITQSTFFSASSTFVMGICLFSGSSVLVYEQIGSFFCVLVASSWFFSVFFLSPLLMFLQRICEHSCWKWGKVSLEHSDGIPGNEIQRMTSDKKTSLMMERWRRLRKFSQETMV